MNLDDILRMAEEAGLITSRYSPDFTNLYTDKIKRFAKLVAKQTKEVCEAEVEYQKQRAQIWRNEVYKLGGKPLPWDADEVLIKAVAAERERCLKTIRVMTEQTAALVQERDELQKQVWLYEKNGVTCQTYRHQVEQSCSECNVQMTYEVRHEPR